MRLTGVTQPQHNALAAHVMAIEPILRTIINTNGAPTRTLTTYTAPGYDITLNPNSEGGVIAGVPSTGGNGVPVNTRVTTRRRGNIVVMTWFDPLGRVYERVYADAGWGTWTEPTRWNNVQYQIINLSAQGLASRDLNLCVTPGVTWTGNGLALVYNCPLEIDDQGGAVDGTALFNGTLQAVPMGANKLRALNATAKIAFQTPIYRGKGWAKRVENVRDEATVMSRQPSVPVADVTTAPGLVGCATTQSDSAICAGTAHAARAHADALLMDGGPISRRTALGNPPRS